MNAKKPMPADFAEMVAKLSGKKALMNHYSVGQKALYRWVSEAGLSLNDGRSAPKDGRSVPQDFAAIAPAMSKEQLRAHYIVGGPVLQRWITETGVEPRVGPQVRRVLPDGFALTAPSMGFGDLMAHYGASKGVIRRWLEETETSPLNISYEARRMREAMKKRSTGNVRPSRGNGGSNVVQLRNGSIYTQAADELRRFCPVTRRDENGVYDENGTHWLVGNVFCDGDELLARAERCKRRAA